MLDLCQELLFLLCHGVLRVMTLIGRKLEELDDRLAFRFLVELLDLPVALGRRVLGRVGGIEDHVPPQIMGI